MKTFIKHLRRAFTGLIVLGVLGAALGAAAAGEFGTAEEAKAMLERAAAAVKQDETAALAAFTAGAEGFRDNDLYVFCGKLNDGMVSAHGAAPLRVGQINMRNDTDATGKKYGEEMFAVAREGEINIVEYVWPRPGESEPVSKASYVSKIGDQICGVGYYK